jgi:hypothetical protein
MNRHYNQRERALLGIAITFYEGLAKATEKNLKRLGLPTLYVQTAIGNVEAIRVQLATTGDTEVEFRHELRVTARDAIELVSRKAEKVKGEQEQLLMPLTGAEEYEFELKALRRAFGEQLELADVRIAAVGDDGEKLPRRRRGHPPRADEAPA